jgi:hypothetical protein
VTPRALTPGSRLIPWFSHTTVKKERKISVPILSPPLRHPIALLRLPSPSPLRRYRSPLAWGNRRPLGRRRHLRPRQHRRLLPAATIACDPTAVPPPAAAVWSWRRPAALHQRHESFMTACASKETHAWLHRGGNRRALFVEPEDDDAWFHCAN